MKPRIPLLACALFVVSFAVASPEGELVSIKPEKPAIGGKLTIRYDTSQKGAALFGAEGIDVQILLIRGKEVPALLERTMKRDGKVWEANVPLDDPKAVFGLVRFAAGKITDTNGDAYWDFLVYNERGEAVEGAHLARSRTFLYPVTDFRRQTDPARAREEVMKEEVLYPGRPETKFTLWRVELSQHGSDEALKQSMLKELDTMAKERPVEPDLLISIAGWYTLLGAADEGHMIEGRLIEQDPHGRLARQIMFGRAMSERDASRRMEQLLDFLKEYPDADRDQKLTVVRLLTQARRYNEAEGILLSLKTPSGNHLNNLAWSHIDEEIDVARGVDLAKKAVEALRDVDPTTRPPYSPRKLWEESLRLSLAAALDTYGYGLYKLSKYEEAEKAYREAYGLGGYMAAEVIEHLTQCYLQVGKYRTAVDVVKKALEDDAYNDNVLAYGKQALLKSGGSEEDFNRMLSEAKQRAQSKAKESILSKRIGQPAKNFEAMNLSGELVRLSDLKGKVVVLDFWATWCGPCKAAFPYVQKVYEKYRGNADLVILAVNTWERVSGEKRKQLVRDFLEQNRYTFPVVYDESKVVDMYGVEGIPTQFYIDRDGNIQFKEVGFHGPEMEESMSMMIDMLLSGETFSVR